MKIPHVTINVKDMEKSIEFYQTVAGITVQGDLRPFGSPIVFLADDKESTKIELILNPDASYEGKGISVGFVSDDVDAEYKRLSELGFELTDIISPNPATKFFFLKDPDGLQIQII